MAKSAQPKALIPNASGRLQAAIEAGREQGKLALYFGCLGRIGHYLHHLSGKTIWGAQREIAGFPWSDAIMDAGLLQNGERPDVYDGKVYWTAGGLALWYAFYWWDRSVDTRGASNSGFYVRGFGWPEAQEAFDYACRVFPAVVARQRHPLVLQSPVPAIVGSKPARAETENTGSVHESPGAEGNRPEEGSGHPIPIKVKP